MSRHLGHEHHLRSWAPSWLPLVANLLAFASPIAAWGQAAPDLGTPAVQVWTIADGLPGASVRAFAQTPDGQIWVATDGGLARFDGQRLRPVPAPAGFERIASTVALAADREGRLWAVPARGEPICVRADVMDDCLPEGHRITNQVRIVDVRTDSGGRMWLATNDLVYVYFGGQLSWLTSFPDEDLGELRSLHVAGDGSLWLAGARGLFRRAPGQADVRRYPIPGEDTPSMRIVTAGRAGAIWAGGDELLLRISPGADGVFRAGKDLPAETGSVTGIVEDRQGVVWIASAKGLYRGRPGSATPWQRLGKLAGGLAQDDVTALFEDRAGQIWLGTRAAGMARLSAPSPGLPAAAPDLHRPGVPTPVLAGALLLLGALVAALMVAKSRRRRKGDPRHPPA